MTLNNKKQKGGRISKAVQEKIKRKSSIKYPSPSPKIEKKSLSPSPSTTSKSTSSSTTTTSTDYRESIKSKDEFKKILSLYDSIHFSTEEEDEQEIENTDGLFFADMSDFLINFEDISDTPSFTSTNTVPVTEKKKTQIGHGEDTGYFVDPLEGTVLYSTSSSVEKDDSKDIIQISSSETESNFGDLISYEGDAIATVFDDSAKNDEESEDILEKMLKLEVEKVEELSDDIDWEAMLKEYQAKKIKQETDEFITELIEKVVEMSEYSSPEDVLRRNLDKRKLMLEIYQTYSKFKSEKLNSKWLQRKVTLFFYNQQTYNFIKPDAYKTLPAIKNKYKEALQSLDKQLTREAALKEAFQVKKSALLEELKERKAKANHQIYSLEDFVRKSLTKDRPENTRISYFILLHIRSMDTYRRAISKARLKLILQQDSYAKLRAQLDKLENLGYGLTIKNYEHIRHQNYELEKELEERNKELYKLHSRLNRCNHILAHHREKQNVLRESIEKNQTNLKNLLEEQHLLRGRMNELKLTRVRIHKEFNYLNFKGGLVNKPLLMYDYDQTVESIIEKRDIIARLRATMATIESRINRLENRFSGSTITSFFNSLSHTM